MTEYLSLFYKSAAVPRASVLPTKTASEEHSFVLTLINSY